MPPRRHLRILGRLQQLILRFTDDESGQDLIEYSLLLSFISFCVLALLMTMKSNVTTLWNDISDTLSNCVSVVS